MPYTGIPTAWIADTLLVGSLNKYEHDNYDGKYFEDSGVLYLLYNTKSLSAQADEDFIVAQAMLLASKPATSAAVPLLGPERGVALLRE